MTDHPGPPTLTTRALLVIAALCGGVALLLFWAWQQADDDDLSPGEARRIIAGEGDDRFWMIDHPVLSGLIVFVAVLVIGRLYLFVRRMEDRDRR